jgi:MoaA/NifB/PqqE/SkfB family radical SAM enzyme
MDKANFGNVFSPPPLPKGLDFTDGEIVQAVKEDRMLMLVIHTPRRCYLKCPYCFTKGWKMKGDYLYLEEYKDVIAQAKELGAKSVWWVGAGEPFLYKHWHGLIKYVTAQDMWIGIFTNGTHISNEIAQVVNKYNVTLYVKMNSFEASVQKKLVGNIEGAYERIQDSIRNLLDVGFNRENHFAIETVVTKLNYEEIPEIFRWARKHRIIPFIEMMEHSNKEAETLDVSLEEHKKLFYQLLKTDRQKCGYSWKPYPPWVWMKCRNLYFSLAIDPQGYVQPCSGMHLRIGNIRKASLKSWWEHPQLRQFRTLKDGVLENYGCRSHAYHIIDNPLAIDPRISVFKSEV